MRILAITPYLPWPLNTGGNAAQFATLKCLMPDHEFVVVCLLQYHKQNADLKQLGKALPGIRFVGVPDGGNDSSRFAKNPAFQAARKFYRDAREVLLQPGQPAPLPEYPFNPLPGNLIQTLQEELKKGVDICQVEFAGMLPLGAWLPPGLPKLFIHHQIHFVYARRFIHAKGDAGGYAHYLEATIRAQEIAFLKCFDSVVTFSQDDREILRPHLSGVEVIASPFPLPVDIEVTTGAPAPFNGTFCFVASEAPANRDALAWLAGDIWPRISAAVPSAKLNIVGNWNNKIKKELSGPKLHFTGFVPELSSVMKGSALLVPLRIGSGIRVKILAAQALGTPVVTTRIGAEGLMGGAGGEMLIRDTAEDFAAAAIELTRQPALWQTLAVAGREGVQKNYSPGSVRASRNQIYDRLRSARPAENGQPHKSGW